MVNNEQNLVTVSDARVSNLKFKILKLLLRESLKSEAFIIKKIHALMLREQNGVNETLLSVDSCQEELERFLDIVISYRKGLAEKCGVPETVNIINVKDVEIEN